MNTLYSGPLSISELLNHKASEPLDASAKEIVERIQSLDVADFNEADVREEIISLLLGVLGYEKQSNFSIDREKGLQLLGRKNFPDYSLTLWSENFWLIEAKRPGRTGSQFKAEDVRQAVGYAVHPEINAALAVICDGRIISVFDREESLLEPIVTVSIAELSRNIDMLRALLSPWQVWFFEKRRILRQLDKVFDKEFNIRRLEEFKSLVARRLDSKRSVVVDNLRLMFAESDDAEESMEMLRSREPEELVEDVFFLQSSAPSAMAIAETLVLHCQSNSFQVLRRVFPDHARDMNDAYCMHALNFLIHLHGEIPNVSWLPEWLGGGNKVESAIGKFMADCLTHFNADPVRRNVLLCASAVRRLFKAMMVVDEQAWRAGEVMHALGRYVEPEDGWMQILSSPQRRNLQRLDWLAQDCVARLVRECSDDKGRPRPRLLEKRLRETWEAEAAVLDSVSSYAELRRERDLGETHPTEETDVVFDSLGYGILCILDHHADWKSHVLKQHNEDVQTLAMIGCGQAREWLGLGVEESFPRLGDRAMADRFFLGDEQIFRRLKTAYGFS